MVVFCGMTYVLIKSVFRKNSYLATPLVSSDELCHYIRLSILNAPDSTLTHADASVMISPNSRARPRRRRLRVRPTPPPPPTFEIRFVHYRWIRVVRLAYWQAPPDRLYLRIRSTAEFDAQNHQSVLTLPPLPNEYQHCSQFIDGQMGDW